MQERRAEPRMLCADMVTAFWVDADGNRREVIANLEDISTSGACLQLEEPVPLGTTLRVEVQGTRFQGCVRHASFCEIGHFIGVEFEPDFKWSSLQVRPRHLLDPRTLLLDQLSRRLGGAH